MVGRLGTAVAPIIELSGRPVKSFLHFVQGPFGLVAFGESFPEVLFLLLEQLRIAAHGGGPVGEGLDDNELGWEVICGRYGIQTHFKGGKTIKNLLVSPKDKDPMLNQSGAIYRYQCNNLGCDDEYIGETSRTFGERYKEHLKAPSAIHHHSTLTGHTTNQNNFQIIGREGHNLARNIKESIYIRVNNPSLNNNIG